MRPSPRTLLLAAGALLLAAQLIRPGRTNPPTDPTATLASTRAADDPGVAVVERSCRDCHTHDTQWPWYSQVAPMSWLVARDVNEGREHLNFSEWTRYDPADMGRKMRGSCEAVESGEMPLWFYLPLHPDAKLTADDIEKLCTMTYEY